MKTNSDKLQNDVSKDGGVRRSRINKNNGWRLGLQILFFGIVGSVSLGQWLEAQGTGVSWLSTACFHAICPFGGVVSIYQLVTAGGFVQKIDQSAFILMYIAFALAIIAGPAFCGWICPMGSFQEWLATWVENYLAKNLIILSLNGLIITSGSCVISCLFW